MSRQSKTIYTILCSECKTPMKPGKQGAEFLMQQQAAGRDVICMDCAAKPKHAKYVSKTTGDKVLA